MSAWLLHPVTLHFCISTDKEGALLLRSLIDLGMYPTGRAFHCFDSGRGGVLGRCEYGLFRIHLASVMTCTGYASLIPNFLDGNNGSTVVHKVCMVHIV